MKVIAMIPARLGSKRIKSKNLRLLNGKPLVCHVSDTAKAAGIFDEIYINSESDIFATIADEYGIKFYRRPQEFSTDSATNDMFVFDFINNISCDIIVQINPTSPLLTVEDVKSFVGMMISGDYDTLHSVKKEQIEGVYKGRPLNFDPLKEMPRSQDLEPVYLFSSGIMAWKVSNYMDNLKNISCGTYGGVGKIGYYTLSGFSTIDIDNEEDFQLAELAIIYRNDPERFASRYYQPLDGLRAETDVPQILKNDGVAGSDFLHENLTHYDIKNIIASQDNSKSWCYRLVNTENNSATLISQLPGEGNRLHHHNDWNEWWYIIEGVWEVFLEGKTFRVKKDEIVFIKKNSWHRIEAVGKNPAVRLAISKDKVAHIYKGSGN